MSGPASLSPKVSFVILTYCQEDIVDQAIDAALAQDYPNLEILFSDDASPDGTFSRLQARQVAYTGSHEFHVRQNEQNMGILTNLVAAIGKTNNDSVLIVVGAGDDISTPDRVSVLTNAWLASGKQASCLYSGVTLMSEQGQYLRTWNKSVPEDYVSAVEQQSAIIGCSAAYCRSVFEDFGSIRSGVQHEDIVLYLRALLKGGCQRVEQKLVRWRQGPSLWKASDPEIVKRTGRKNGLLKALAYSQAKEDYLTFCAAQGRSPNYVNLRALDGQIAEGRGFYALTQGRLAEWALGGIRRPCLLRHHAKALRRYLKLRKQKA